ncbi:hypothetical protein BLNAU_404 [Blattamonas nauphoetae]|uniref:Tyrosine specific protein phosphatases domain-containing protein n=1 Tax=Blattamonas nauphoetae TaxID=2049346 RepID=A0ABQ9YL57_9EUKA|nr:hypothetical protein BLNAU_404 [Blattamonas nauphoetae]
MSIQTCCSNCQSTTDLNLCVYTLPMELVKQYRLEDQAPQPIRHGDIFAAKPQQPPTPADRELFILCNTCIIIAQQERDAVSCIPPLPSTIALVIPLETITPDFLLQLYSKKRIIHTPPNRGFRMCIGNSISNIAILHQAERSFTTTQYIFEDAYRRYALDDDEKRPRMSTPLKVTVSSPQHQLHAEVSSPFTTSSQYAYQHPDHQRLTRPATAGNRERMSKIIAQPTFQGTPQNSAVQHRVIDIIDVPSEEQPPIQQLPKAIDADAQTSEFPISNPFDISHHDPSFQQQFSGPTSKSNWIIPGRVLMSAYPETPSEVEKLLLSGVDTFVDLTTDGEGNKGPHSQHFDYFTTAVRSVRMDQLLRMKATMEKERLMELESVQKQEEEERLQKKQKLLKTKTMSQRQRREEMYKLQNEQIEQEHYVPLASEKIAIPERQFAQKLDSMIRIVFPIEEGQCGRDDETRMLIDFIANRLINNGSVICIHSLDGHGRTGLICTLLLIRLFNVSAVTALDALQKFHRCRSVDSHYMSPASHLQKMQIYSIASHWKRGEHESDESVINEHCARYIQQTGLDIVRQMAAARIPETGTRTPGNRTPGTRSRTGSIAGKDKATSSITTKTNHPSATQPRLRPKTAIGRK